MSEIIDVKIFIMPNGDEVDLELPITSTPLDIIASLLEDEELNIPRADPVSGETISYKILKRGKEREDEEVEIEQDMSLGEQGILGFAVLSLVPEFVPGALM